jgi:alpha-ketoglutarate-dependent 2,4-dichlorophenoxyacetate dioxygenase
MLVRTLPESGRKTLYLALHIGRILGLPDDEAAALVDELVAHATSPAYVYRHRWRVGDVVMWDNRCTMHHVTDYDDLRWPRDYKRATISDVANTLIQEGVPIPEAYRAVAAA